KDYIRSVLEDLGATVHFEAVAMSPGRSFIFATFNGKTVFCFPGSPRASRTLAWLFLCPAIQKVAGHPTWNPRELAAVLEENLTPAKGVTRFLPACLSRHAEGLKVRAVDEGGTEDRAPSPEVNALLVIPPDVDFLLAGYEVRVIRIDEVHPDPEEVY
ncbi:MAG: molybdopterin-binding protein, partial [Planctomycetota bacterium]